MSKRELMNEVEELNPSNRSFEDCDYFKWLSEKDPDNIHAIETKKEYLQDRFNYDREKHCISPNATTALKAIEEMYFWEFIRNKDIQKKNLDNDPTPSLGM